MDEAAKAATAEANAKRKAAGKKEPTKQETTVKSEPAAPAKPEASKPFSLFDEPTPGVAAPAIDPVDEENEIMAEAGQDEDHDEDDELDEAA